MFVALDCDNNNIFVDIKMLKTLKIVIELFIIHYLLDALTYNK